MPVSIHYNCQREWLKEQWYYCSAVVNSIQNWMTLIINFGCCTTYVPNLVSVSGPTNPVQIASAISAGVVIHARLVGSGIETSSQPPIQKHLPYITGSHSVKMDKTNMAHTVDYTTELLGATY